MSIVLFDNNERNKLYPLNNVCAVADLRVGILTARERWGYISKDNIFINTADYLSVLYEPVPQGLHIWIDANLIPDEYLIGRIFSLAENQALADSKGLIAGRKNFGNDFNATNALRAFERVHKIDDTRRIEYPWNIFQCNNEILREDFARITAGRSSQQLPKSNQYIDPENIFIEEGAVVNFSIINAATGPVYIGKNCTIMEGCTIRGPVALCEGTVLKMGTKIYGATTLGPHCVGGGEIKNVVMQGYSNKAHEGYLGDAVIGKWCNLGAGTSNSNLKNNAGEVKIWTPRGQLNAGHKCGVFMGDYSRSMINTSFNTGTVVGACCNVFGSGLTPKYLPSFSWGNDGIDRYEFDRAMNDIANWKKLKGKKISKKEKNILKHIFGHY